MPELSKIEPSDFEAIYDKYLRDDDPRFTREDWQRLFQPICRASEQPEYGYKLTEHGQIVGMLGMLSSNRIIGNAEVPFCNLHSWFVDEEHRGSSLLLMRPILRMKDHVITDLTPTAPVIQISLKLGFQLINSPQMILRSRVQPAGDACRCKLYWNNEIDTERLSRAEAQISDDHSETPFERLLITTEGGHCLLVIRRIDIHWKPYASILFASVPEILLTTQASWQPEVGSHLKVKRIVGAQNHLPKSLIGIRQVPLVPKQLFRSTNIAADQIDTLYSEVSLLGLTTLPGIKSIVKHKLNSLNPMYWISSKSQEC